MDYLSWILGSFPLFLTALALILYLFSWTGEALTRYLLLLPIGLGGLWGFILHAFFPDFAASHIGWPSSPFQYEVAMANLGLGIAGIVGFRKSWDYALAVTLVVACFLGGTAYIHIVEIFGMEDFAPGNVGTILYSDFLIPLLLAISLCYWKREAQHHW